MQHALSTHVFLNHRLNIAMLEQIQSTGIPLIEIFCARQHIDSRQRSQISELGLWFRDSPLRAHSLHAPMYMEEHWDHARPDNVITITEPVKAKRVKSVDEIKRVLEIAETVPFRYLIQHVGVPGEEFSDRAVDSAFTALEELKLFAGHRGVEILLENIPNELSSAEGLLTFLGRTHLDLGFCFDTGHAHMQEGVANAYKMMKERIRSTHVHDNNGKDDSHCSPCSGDGSIDWRGTMELLRPAADQYPLLLELKEAPEMPNSLDAIRRIFDQLEELKPQHES